MHRTWTLPILGGIGIFLLGLATGLTASGLSDSPARVEQQRTDLSGTAGMEVIASLIEIAPGDSSRLHTHHGVEAYHVLQGAPIDVPGIGAAELVTGATAFNLRDVAHGAFTVRGDVPLKLLTIHVVDKDRPLYDYVQP